MEKQRGHPLPPLPSSTSPPLKELTKGDGAKGGGKNSSTKGNSRVSYAPSPTALQPFTTDRPRQENVDAFINGGSLKLTNSGDLAKIMYLSVKLWKWHGIEVPQRHLLKITDRIEEMNHAAWRAKDVAFLMYPLQIVSLETNGCLQYMCTLTKIIRESLKGPMAIDSMLSQGVSMMIYSLKSLLSVHCVQVRDMLSALSAVLERWNHPINSMEVGNVLYGLQRCSSEHEEVRGLLKVLVARIKAGGNDLNAQVVGNSLYGLQNMSSEHEGVTEALQVLADKFSQMDRKTTLGSQEIGNAFYGLKNMSSEEPAVRAILKVLHDKLLQSASGPGFVLDAQALGNSLYGLRRMTTDHEEVAMVVGTLASLMTHNREEFTAQGVSNALYGLNNMRSDRPEVQQVLWSLLPKIHQCRQDFANQHVASCFFGLRRIKSDCPAALQVLAALIVRIHACKKEFVSQNCSNCLFGLQGMSSDFPEVRGVLAALIPRIRSCRRVDGQFCGNACFGLQNMESDSFEVREMLSVVADKIRACRGELTPQQISNALYGLQNMSSDYAEVRDILSALSMRLHASRQVFNSQNVGYCMYGLKDMNSEWDEVVDVLKCLASKVRSLPYINDQCIGMVLFSLRGMSSACPAVRELVADFIPHLHAYQGMLTRQCVGNMCYGLQRLTSDWEEVRELCKVLGLMIRHHFEDGLDTQSCSNALFGCQGLDSVWPQVRELLGALARHMRSCTDPSSPQQVDNSSYGCQGMDSSHPEVLEVLAALAPQISSCTQPISAEQIGNALLGLQGLCSDKAEVRSMVAALVPHIALCSERFTSQEVWSCLFALQGMTHDCPEVRQLLDVLTPKVLTSEALSCFTVGNSLYGVLGVMWAEPFFSTVSHYLYNHLSEMTYDVDDSVRLAVLSCEDVVQLRLGVGLYLPLAQAVLGRPGSPYSNWERINVLLAHELDRRKRQQDPFFLPCDVSVASSDVRSVYESTCAVCQNPDHLKAWGCAGDVEVIENTFLFNFIECDVVIRLPTAGKQWLTINIEIVGSRHRNSKSARHRSIRDHYLTSSVGVAVAHVTSTSLRDMSSDDVQRWVHSIIEQELLKRNKITTIDL